MPKPTLTPAYILAAITTVVALFLTQGLIDSKTEKLVTGLAAVLVPAIFVLAHALFHGRVQAATIQATATRETARKP
jgi:hypothetical protein